MIKLNNVSKYFNKGKPNEIRAVENTSLTLESGLVMLVGRSGCGKTTLLNVLGGLEKPDCGSITVGDTTIDRYHCEQWDKLRNQHIGYIFQNYNLLEELTVYQNLELVLKLAGVDPATYEQRIRYALSLVGMEKYVMRRPSSLSGGQQQRVGIARALVKGADIIIADEPTGNLDDTNTVAVMQLLKGLSKHCLVVVVTHEEDLAAFYADRIIRIVDGKVVSDEDNTSNGSLAHRAADHIYLGDMEQTEWHTEEMDVTLFRDQAALPRAKVYVVCQNGRILLQVKGTNMVSMVTDDSSIVLDEGKFEAEADKFAQDLPVDTDILSRGNGKPRAVFTMKTAFGTVWSKFRDKIGVRRRNPYRLLYITAFLFVFMIAAVAPAFVYNRMANVVCDDHMVAVYTDETKAAELVSSKEHILSRAAMFYLNLANDTPFDTTFSVQMNGSSYLTMIPYSWVGGKVGDDEFYMDEFLYERLKTNYELQGIVDSKQEMVGMYFRFFDSSITSYSYFEPLNCSMEIKDMGETTPKTLRLAGFVNRNQPVVYLSDNNYNALSEVQYKVNYNDVPVTLIYCADPKAFVKSLPNTVGSVIINEKQRDEFLRDAIVSKLGSVIVALIAVIIQIFCLHRMAKSEYLGKIRMYSQYRAIGVGRNAIYAKISMESGVVSLLSSLRGWLFASVLLWILSRIKLVVLVSQLGFTLYYYPVWVGLLCALFLFVLGQVVNLLSPVTLLARTPAHMMSKYDI